MILERKRMRTIVRFTLVMFILCTLISYTGSIPVNAGISSQKKDLISALYPILDNDIKRAEVFNIIVKIETYEMKDISAPGAAEEMAKQINSKLGGASINEDTLETLLQDFYDYQQSNPLITGFILRQFKEGLDIENDRYASYGNFDSIKAKIETYTYSYLLFVNFVKEVKDVYGILKSSSYNPLYLDANNEIQIYDDLLAISNIATYFTDNDRAEHYRDLLSEDLLDALNDMNSTQRVNFAKNLNAHNLLDLRHRDSIVEQDDDEDEDRPSGSGGGGDDTTPPPSTPTVNQDGSSTVQVSAALNNTTGNASVTVNENTISQLLNLSKPQADGTKDIIIEVPKVTGAKGYTLDIPGNAISKPAATEELTIKTDMGSIAVPSDIFANDQSVKNKNVSLNISQADKTTLPADIQQKIGDKPVVSLSFMVNGSVKEYNNPDAPVTVTLNYKPTGAEALDSEFIVVWYIDNAGKLVEVPSGRYDAATGTVTFTTTHFSRYAIAYNHKVFTDIDVNHWAKKTIEILASRGIAKGITDSTFAPNDNITRGDYMAMLIRAMGVNAVITENFSDVAISDVNFKEIAIAKKLGITNGVGDNKFMPGEYISRQDLMVMTDRALTVMKKIKEKGTAAELEKFSDNSELADYAKVSAATMIKEGLILGSGNLIGPQEKTTRAQAATIVYRIYNK